MYDFAILITAIGALIIIAVLIFILIASYNVFLDYEDLIYAIVTIGLLLFFTGPIIMINILI